VAADAPMIAWSRDQSARQTLIGIIAFSIRYSGVFDCTYSIPDLIQDAPPRRRKSPFVMPETAQRLSGICRTGKCKCRGAHGCTTARDGGSAENEGAFFCRERPVDN